LIFVYINEVKLEKITRISHASISCAGKFSKCTHMYVYSGTNIHSYIPSIDEMCAKTMALTLFLQNSSKDYKAASTDKSASSLP
jgi:hypothetical protein